MVVNTWLDVETGTAAFPVAVYVTHWARDATGTRAAATSAATAQLRSRDGIIISGSTLTAEGRPRQIQS